MTESVYVNAAKDKVVAADSPEAAYRIHTKDAKRLGLLKEPKASKVAENGDTPKRTYTRRSKS